MSHDNFNWRGTLEDDQMLAIEEYRRKHEKKVENGMACPRCFSSNVYFYESDAECKSCYWNGQMVCLVLPPEDIDTYIPPKELTRGMELPLCNHHSDVYGDYPVLGSPIHIRANLYICKYCGCSIQYQELQWMTKDQFNEKIFLEKEAKERGMSVSRLLEKRKETVQIDPVISELNDIIDKFNVAVRNWGYYDCRAALKEIVCVLQNRKYEE